MNSRQRVEWNEAYKTGNCAWDTEFPSPELVSRLSELKLPASRVLDIGCGTGANALFLASLGHSVVAIDFADRAIQQARLNGRTATVPIEFRGEDFLLLDDYHEEFDFVFDSGCYHSIRKRSLKRYMETLYRVMKPSAFCVSLVGNNEDGQRWGPARVSALELLSEHSPYFELLDLRRFSFDSTIPESRPLGWSALMQRRIEQRTLATLLPPDSGLASSTVQFEGNELNLIKRVTRIIDAVEFSESCPWKVNFELYENKELDCVDLLIRYEAIDTQSGNPTIVNYKRTGAFKNYFKDEELLHILLANLAVVAVHEILESFMLNGESVFDPHGLSRFLDTRYAELIMMTPTGAIDSGAPR